MREGLNTPKTPPKHPYQPGKAMDNREVTVRVSEEIYAILDYWAWLNGRTVPMFIAQIASSRAGANLSEIEELSKYSADLQGISVEELKKKWRDSRGKSSAGGGDQQ